MSDTYHLRITISRASYIQLKRIALGQNRPMNRQLERIIDEWQQMTKAPMPGLGVKQPPAPATIPADYDLAADLQAIASAEARDEPYRHIADGDGNDIIKL